MVTSGLGSQGKRKSYRGGGRGGGGREGGVSSLLGLLIEIKCRRGLANDCPSPHPLLAVAGPPRGCLRT